MSLILEALKKSEAERRLGHAPGLLSPAPPVVRRHLAPWILAPVALLALAGVVASAWWLGRSGPTAPMPAPVAQADTDTVAPAQSGPEDAPAPARTGVPGGEIVLPQTQARSEPVPSPPASPALLPPDLDAAPASSVRTGPAAAATGPGLPDPAPTASAPPAPAPEAGADSQAGPPLEPLPTLRELAAAERAALPPLSITMHVYAEVPDQRFVLIDGRRRSEGDRLGEGLVLEQIRRDGVVLNLQGRRFLLPRPG